MATTFLEPGGDATFNVATSANGGLWNTITGAPAIATDFVNGNHIKSIQFRGSITDRVTTFDGTLSDSGSRISFYVYFTVLPAATASFVQLFNSGGTATVVIRITPAGVVQLWNTTTAQIGTDGATLSAGVWYRISLAYTIASTSVNRFELFVNGAPSISVTNATITTIVTSRWGPASQASSVHDMRASDFYTDNSSSLTDPGNIWVTAKRPNANGSVNGFTTQIGAGGSGYGSGHSPQVNERALSTTNGWSMIGAGSAVTEEYSIENTATGDIDISKASIIDYMGWVYAKAALSETASIIVAGASSNISLTSTNTMFTKIAGSTTYPAGNTDIGVTTATTVTTVSLYECGVVVAYIPASGHTKNLLTLGVG